MSEILNTLLKVDLTKVPLDVIEGLKSGLMKLSSSNGVVYWAEGSGGSGVVMQLPMIAATPQELASVEQLLQLGSSVQAAKTATLAATAVSAAVVISVVVVATAYLSVKIDRISSAIGELGQIVGQQDQREYLERVSDYLGAVRSAQELLSARASSAEIEGLALHRMDRLSELRQKALAIVRGISQIISDSKSTKVQYVQAMHFMIGMLDIVPVAIAVERELCLVAGKPGLAQRRSQQAAAHFRSELAEFKAWSETQYLQLAKGQGGFPGVLLSQREELQKLFNSPIHGLLLDGMTGATIFGEAAGSVADNEDHWAQPSATAAHQGKTA